MLLFFFLTETRHQTKVLSVQCGGAPELHKRARGPDQVHLQALVQGRGGATVPRANLHPPPLGAQAFGEGEMQAVRKGERYESSCGKLSTAGALHSLREREPLTHYFEFAFYCR